MNPGRGWSRGKGRCIDRNSIRGRSVHSAVEALKKGRQWLTLRKVFTNKVIFDLNFWDGQDFAENGDGIPIQSLQSQRGGGEFDLGQCRQFGIQETRRTESKEAGQVGSG